MWSINKKYKVYKITFPNKKVYIGFTSNFRNRMRDHRFGYKYNPNSLLYRAINFYGFDNCTIDIIYKSDDREEALAKEIQYIEHYESRNNKHGYNLAIGGVSKPEVSNDIFSKINIVGKTFGFLKVIKRSNKLYLSGSIVWECKCICGNKVLRAAIDLRSNKNKVKSCGCKTKETIILAQKTHGKTKSPEYIVWKRIKAGCLAPYNKDYKTLGAKGIKMESSWVDRFENFYKDMGPKPTAHSRFTRLNKEDNFNKSNCRWVG